MASDLGDGLDIDLAKLKLLMAGACARFADRLADHTYDFDGVIVDITEAGGLGRRDLPAVVADACRDLPPPPSYVVDSAPSAPPPARDTVPSETTG